jgi:CheY-like chemotaxis protein/anti-sigma regulatory factor (Ser/Thr protein kinase)
MASPLLEQRRQQVECLVPAEGLPVDADRDRLAQVISNLLTNAAKYSEPGTKIQVTAARTDGQVRLQVRDQGVGIAPEMLSSVFDLFVQQPQSLDRSKGGLGLGLAIVRSLTELHGGHVTATSAGPGKGSEFTVELPLAAGTEAIVAVDAVAGGSPRVVSDWQVPSRRRILVVDDNQDAAQILAELLVQLGFEVHVAHDGPSALAAASSFRPHICLLDIGLPVMDGYELAERLRRMPGLPAELRMIAITGYGQDADRLRSRAAGFNAHMVKPVSWDALTKLLLN